MIDLEAVATVALYLIPVLLVAAVWPFQRHIRHVSRTQCKSSQPLLEGIADAWRTNVIDLEQYRLAKAIGWTCFTPEQIAERNGAIARFIARERGEAEPGGESPAQDHVNSSKAPHHRGKLLPAMLPRDGGFTFDDGEYQLTVIAVASRWDCEVLESGVLVYRRTDMTTELEARDAATDWIHEQRCIAAADELKRAG